MQSAGLVPGGWSTAVPCNVTAHGGILEVPKTSWCLDVDMCSYCVGHSSRDCVLLWARVFVADQAKVLLTKLLITKRITDNLNFSAIFSFCSCTKHGSTTCTCQAIQTWTVTWQEWSLDICITNISTTSWIWTIPWLVLSITTSIFKWPSLNSSCTLSWKRLVYLCLP